MDQRLANGTKLDTFRIIRLIGKGGMGEVYEAYEDLLNRKVALKIIAIDGSGENAETSATAGQREAIQSFISEGQALAKLNHPNVVTIYRLGMAEGIHYIAMEYVEGRSLKSLISKGEINFQYAIKIMDKIISGTKALHEKNIIHRDLKPKNILISKDKTIKIVDFGIAETHKENKSKNNSGKIVGSVFYIPPEVIKGKSATLQSDIWNLGVIFYEMLVGEKPFYGKSPDEILKKVKEKDIKFSMAKKLMIPPEVQTLILKMGARDPLQRYQNIVDAQIDLRQFMVDSKDRSGASSNTNSSKMNLNTATLPQHASRTHKLPTHTYKAPQRQKSSKSPLAFAVALVVAMSAIAWWVTKGQNMEFEDQTSIEDPVILPPVIDPPPQFESPVPAPVKQPVVRATTKPPVVVKPVVKKPVRRPTRLARVRLEKSFFDVTLKFKGMPSRSPASILRSVRNAPVLKWNAVKGAAFYLVEVDKAGKFERSDKSKVKGLSYKFVPIDAGTYFWRVTAMGSGSKAGKPSSVGKISISLPTPKLNKSTYKFSTRSRNSRLSWAKVPLARDYRVLVSSDRRGRRVVFNEIARRNSFSSMPKLPGTYYVKVTALGPGRKPASKGSALSKLILSKPVTKRMRLGLPSIQTPLNGIRVPSGGAVATPIIFGWERVIGAVNYEVQISRDRNFSKVVFSTSTNQNEYVFTKLLSPGAVYWRVRATARGKQSSPWTDLRSFVLE